MYEFIWLLTKYFKLVEIITLHDICFITLNIFIVCTFMSKISETREPKAFTQRHQRNGWKCRVGLGTHRSGFGVDYSMLPSMLIFLGTVCSMYMYIVRNPITFQRRNIYSHERGAWFLFSKPNNENHHIII